jgi:hypothetical protein
MKNEVYEKIVQSLNDELMEKNPKLYEDMGICFTFCTNGYAEIIEFMDYVLYSSDNDESFETTKELEIYIKNRTKDLIKNLVLLL